MRSRLGKQHFGPNVISEKRGQGPLVRFLLQFHQPLIYILLLAAVVTGVFKEWVDAVVIFGVVVINAIVGFIQESKALGAIAALAKAIASEATVIRSGQKRRLPAASLVPGDIVLLQSGDKVPADLRLTRTRDLQIDESALTGESVPAQKAHGVLAKETGLADRRNMAYSSTLVTFGTGTGVVVATGDRTEIGQISEMIASTEVLDTPLMQKIKQFSHFLLVVILVLAALTFFIDILRGKDWLFTFKVAVALAIGAIPEGLARRRDHHAGDRRVAHGPAKRHHPQASCRGDARQCDGHLFRQDRHPHQEPDDRPGDLGRRSALRGERNRI